MTCYVNPPSVFLQPIRICEYGRAVARIPPSPLRIGPLCVPAHEDAELGDIVAVAVVVGVEDAAGLELAARVAVWVRDVRGAGRRACSRTRSSRTCPARPPTRPRRCGHCPGRPPCSNTCSPRASRPGWSPAPASRTGRGGSCQGHTSPPRCPLRVLGDRKWRLDTPSSLLSSAARPCRFQPIFGLRGGPFAPDFRDNDWRGAFSCLRKSGILEKKAGQPRPHAAKVFVGTWCLWWRNGDSGVGVPALCVGAQGPPCATRTARRHGPLGDGRRGAGAGDAVSRGARPSRVRQAAACVSACRGLRARGRTP